VSTRLSLLPQEIHLWLAFYAEIRDPHLHAAYREILSAEERAQEPRFHFPADRRRYLVTRALVRTVLSRYAPIAPADWVFAENAYGRPHAVNAVSPDSSLSFNISHTHSLIVLGITSGRDLGVDVESVCARAVSLGVAEHYFAPAEVAALATVPASQQQYRFFEYWTFKESYIKARGMGLSLPLDEFAFHFPDDRSVNIEINSGLKDNPTRWQFWQFQPTPEYLVAVCAQRLAVSSSLVVRTIVPGSSERTLAPRLLRVSG
jgi:4'-phosphopantetheinyl transferase